MIQISLRESKHSDTENIANLRAMVLREDLTRLGRYDEEKVRQRFRDSFDPDHTWIIEAEPAFVGCVAFKPATEGYLLEHFYIHPHYQGQGIGGHVLNTLLGQADLQGSKVRLNVLQGSSARRLYERFGFEVDSEDSVDIFMSRKANGTIAHDDNNAR
ncbi:GNAT family N-acetyltransferase [Paenibacillus sp. HJL G12]|uniref:GNAT family N-acetyltransferase n=1 Tax=Paenibacillus dendrobii TaxID=2691084 RepID=A0A7X3IGQ8_9BACL|nr:GNAT family N-acetyltransferase [Paenibacillus dendrobii]MWV43638.1 GNAT family N-acetyltransferase [Paenibacillus dendrobii]